jgi:membrane-bound lytic murein transglycosylase A
MNEKLTQIGFNQLNGWEEDNHLAAMDVFLKTARRMIKKPYHTKGLGISSELLVEIAGKAVAEYPFNPSSAKAFFERYFLPCQLIDGDSALSGERGFVTAYYEPEVLASRVKTAAFSAPLYSRPKDLIDVTDENRPEGFDRGFRFARKITSSRGAQLEEHPDRESINAGYLEGKGLEIAWVKDVVEALFIHIQGSARLRFDDGACIRVGYAAKSGHPYTAVGKILLERGDLKPDNCGMQSIRQWFSSNPGQVNSVVSQNRSYIFFNEYPVISTQDGPVGAAKVDLTPYRSLAVDRNLHTYGIPIWIETSNAFPGNVQPFKKLMIAQDTGSAIIGPLRGDLYLGSGDAAGKIAGEIRHAVKFVLLVPKNTKSTN